MNYIEYDFTVEPLYPGNEILTAALSELPFESFEENQKGLKAYIAEDRFSQEEFDGLFLWDLPEIKISFVRRVIPDQNWNAVWESNFTPIDIDGKCMIRADFHPAPSSGLDIVITPKMSFGTGHHQTTYLMMRHLLDTPLDGLSVCDMGCGTGVLAITAERLGARRVLAVDIDPWSEENTRENVARNGCSKIQVRLGGAEAVEGGMFDVFMANINRNILCRDMGLYAKAIPVGGKLFLSGFFTADIPRVCQSAEPYGFRLVSTLEKDNWAALCLIKEN